MELLPAATLEEIAAALPGAKLVDGSPLLQALRLIKTPEEVARLRRAARGIDHAVRLGFAATRPGMTEREPEAIIHKAALDEGRGSLYIQVGTGARGAYGTMYSGDAVIRRGDVIRVDAAGTYQWYTSDIGRCRSVGEPTAEQAAYYDVTYRGEMAAMELIRPGVKVADLFRAAVGVPLVAGFADFRRHHVGHGIGLQAHERPFLQPDNQQELAEGMVLCVEVPYYVYGLGAFVSEDMVLVTRDGYELLTEPAPTLIPAGGS